MCTHERECLFGHVVNGEMRLTPLGRMATAGWRAIPHHFPRVVLDEGIIMPNHTHGIIVIQGRGEASDSGRSSNTRGETADASPLGQRPNGTQPGSLSAVVQNFKSISTPKMNAASGILGTPVRQCNYYEHVVRNDEQLKAIREYILADTALWDEEENNPLRPDCGHGKMAGTPWVT